MRRWPAPKGDPLSEEGDERALAGLAWSALPASPTVLVPLGSTEQHGPHLPLHTDTTIATAVARAVAARLRFLVAPAVAYGASGEHQDFPGTMSIGTEALQVLLVELVRSLSRWAGQVVIVNGHGGNLRALAAAVARLRYEGHAVVWAPCTTPGTDAHAGHAETSLMLHLAPHLVDLARAAPGNLTPLADLAHAHGRGRRRRVPVRRARRPHHGLRGGRPPPVRATDRRRDDPNPNRRGGPHRPPPETGRVREQR